VSWRRESDIIFIKDVVKAITRTVSKHNSDSDGADDPLRRYCTKARRGMEDVCNDLVRSTDGQEYGEFVLRGRIAD
jgi:hypothetical protein